MTVTEARHTHTHCETEILQLGEEIVQHMQGGTSQFIQHAILARTPTGMGHARSRV